MSGATALIYSRVVDGDVYLGTDLCKERPEADVTPLHFTTFVDFSPNSNCDHWPREPQYLLSEEP